MKKKSYLYSLIVLSILIISTILITLKLPTYKDESSEINKMSEAYNKCVECFDKIKEYKIRHNINKTSLDKFDSYLIGDDSSAISTEEGDIKSKYTSINPNFAALYIKLFKEANLKENDWIGVNCSGSFIGLNISLLAAASAYNLNVYLMASVGASTYGATDTDFNNVDILHYLYTSNLIRYDVDLASFGGEADLGNEFNQHIKESIKNRIVNQYHIEFIDKNNFSDNVNYRYNKLKEHNIKLFVNVGGCTTSLGYKSDSFVITSLIGLINKEDIGNRNITSNNIGLIDKCLNEDISVIHMLHLKSLCSKYDMQFNFASIPSFKEEMVYYEYKYNKVLPIITISISIILFILYYLDKKNIIHLFK